MNDYEMGLADGRSDRSENWIPSNFSAADLEQYIRVNCEMSEDYVAGYMVGAYEGIEK